MTEFDLEKLLGTNEPDPGCDEAGELMDAYCEAVARGEKVSEGFDAFAAHVRNCDACREDTEGLLAVLRAQDESEPR